MFGKPSVTERLCNFESVVRKGFYCYFDAYEVVLVFVWRRETYVLCKPLWSLHWAFLSTKWVRWNVPENRMIAKRHNGQVKSRLSIRESGVCLGSEENVELAAKHFDRPAFIVRRHHKNDFRFLTIVFASKQIHRLWVESSGGQKPFDHYCHPIFIVSSPHMHAHKNNFFLKKSDLILIRHFNQNLFFNMIEFKTFVNIVKCVALIAKLGSK